MYQIRLQNLPAEERSTLRQRLTVWAEERGGSMVDVMVGAETLYMKGVKEDAVELLRTWNGIQSVFSEKAAAHESLAALPSIVEVKAARFGGGSASCIAGPCAVENFDSLMSLAEQLAAAGATGLRGGAFKPRTSPYSFQGLGELGLEMLSAAGKATGLAVVTEVLDVRDLDLVAKHADVLQIGSRNMTNAPLLQEVGRAGLPILLKRGMSATLEEFLFAAEYVALGGAPSIMLCERGLRHFDPAVRNVLDLAAVPALKQRTGLPVIVDPSHGTGVARLVPAMMLAAAAAGADGFLVEVHPNPSASWSDADQALPMDIFSATLPRVAHVLEACERNLHGYSTNLPAEEPKI
ncbi:MAG: 3-deoxy-7-phosphoheptulonate synthase [Planctomycetota bacterium]|nr:3-deoxy-7-phosphoheptulonate synthase [Planctomycetota bacterium]MDA1114020.1 3-deoxy-7-phosphoheptulonate synthase [Planctomycetota bacterium]